MSIQTFEQSFPIQDKAIFRLSNINGQVIIRQGEEGVIWVKADLDEASGNPEHTKVEMRQENSGRVVVETRFNEHLLGFLVRSQPCRVNYEVRLPANVDLDVSMVAANLELQSLQGKFKISTISGSVRLSNLAGLLDVSSISGTVHGENLSSDKLSLSLVSGDLRLSDSQIAAVDANTVSGQIMFQSPLGAGPYHFRSVSGDVNWSLPTAVPCTVEMHTVSGDLLVNAPISRVNSGRTSKVWQIMGGGTSVKLNSVSGDLMINAPQELPLEKDASQSRMEILDKIESGEMTAEEALTALNAL